MNENNSMAYTPNDSMPSDSPQNYSVYTQDGAAQANAAQTDMAQNNAAQTDTAQNNTAQTDLVQKIGRASCRERV